MDVSPVYVVIPTWNLKEDLIECITSLLASSFDALHIVVVDNGSTDGTATALSQKFGETVNIVQRKEKMGFARAVNEGVAYAIASGAELVLILNNDTLVDDRMVEQLVAVLDNHPDAGMVGPVIYYADFPDRIWQVGSRQLIGPPLTWRLLPKQCSRNTLEADYLTGCAMLVRKEVFEALKGFKTDYHMYFEDADFCRRAQLSGFGMLVATKAKMWHKVSLSSRNTVADRAYDQSRGRVLFLLRYSPHFLWLLAHIYIWGYLVLDWGRSIFHGGGITMMRAVLRGTLAGYKFFFSQPKLDI